MWGWAGGMAASGLLLGDLRDWNSACRSSLTFVLEQSFGGNGEGLGGPSVMGLGTGIMP